ncbi:hypothetical protein [Opitutus terrae]|uniref:hypothetical protein n=1 Tax=Opitutus terrae TaxID=107709 RepID=UPI0005D0EA86|nr:hypothetical protein [Opitutus terrae]
MNNGNSEPSQLDLSARSTRSVRSAVSPDELTRLKHELLQAEVRLAKARATAAGAEIDIKVLNARLKAFAK